MRLVLKSATLLTLVAATACAAQRPNVSLGLGPITCPPSMLELTEGPEAIDPNFVSRLSEPDQRYILRRESGWEASIDEANNKVIDGLAACTNYNRALEAAR